MSESNSAQEPTNFPVGNKDEVPSQSPKKVQTPEQVAPEIVDNDNPEKDIADAKAARQDGVAPAAVEGDSIETPATDPNRGNAKPAKSGK